MRKEGVEGLCNLARLASGVLVAVLVAVTSVRELLGAGFGSNTSRRPNQLRDCTTGVSGGGDSAASVSSSITAGHASLGGVAAAAKALETPVDEGGEDGAILGLLVVQLLPAVALVGSIPSR